MKIVSENKDAHLTLEVITPEPQYPSVRLYAAVTDEGFSGAGSEIWIFEDSLKQFLADLQACERTRRGKAILSSISPGELELVVEQCDGWGHFLLRYTLSKTSYASRVVIKKMVSGGFELDSGSLGEIVAEFADLLPPVST